MSPNEQLQDHAVLMSTVTGILTISETGLTTLSSDVMVNSSVQERGNDLLTGRAVWQTLRSNMRTGSRSRLLIVGVQDCK